MNDTHKYVINAYYIIMGHNALHSISFTYLATVSVDFFAVYLYLSFLSLTLR